MDRRNFFKTGGMALAGFGLAGCGPKKVVQTAPTLPRALAFAPRPAIDLTPPRITWERVIRTTIGLRPHRDSGFVLKGVKFDDRTVIHDYGFGGAGMSLAWGCGAMAADMALEQGDRRAAVLGCGSPGLTAARHQEGGLPGAAVHDVEHVVGRLHANRGAGVCRPAHAGVGRAVQASG